MLSPLLDAVLSVQDFLLIETQRHNSSELTTFQAAFVSVFFFVLTIVTATALSHDQREYRHAGDLRHRLPPHELHSNWMIVSIFNSSSEENVKYLFIITETY